MKNNSRVKQIQKLLDVAEGNLASARNLLLDILGEKKTGKVDHTESAKDLSILDEGKIIEGIFDGEQMTAPDGKKYPVPANYASKSKLVEGDTLKLTIAENGAFIYKQIKPVERKNLMGTLSLDNGNYTVLADGKKYKVLFASVTYYKGQPGNKASIVVPAEKESTWAALESIIHEHGEDAGQKNEPQKQEKKLELPKENKEILREVKENFEKKEEGLSEPAQKDARTEKLKPETEKPQPEITDDMTVQEASQASTEEEVMEKDSIDEHPDIKKQGDYMPEEDSEFVKEEKNTNSLGEEPPTISNKTQNTQELEI